jgi:hypothetical protein
MKQPHLIWTAMVIVLLAAVPTTAHHGWSSYDETAAVSITGTVRAVAYAYPHATLQLQSEGHESQVWQVVLAPPTQMESRGLKQDSLKAGTLLTAMGYVHKQHATELRAERLTIAGTTTNLR